MKLLVFSDDRSTELLARLRQVLSAEPDFEIIVLPAAEPGLTLPPRMPNHTSLAMLARLVRPEPQALFPLGMINRAARAQAEDRSFSQLKAGPITTLQKLLGDKPLVVMAKPVQLDEVLLRRETLVASSTDRGYGKRDYLKPNQPPSTRKQIFSTRPRTTRRGR